LNAVPVDPSKIDRSKRWFIELGGLISTMPDLSQRPSSADALKWFGRVNTIMIEMGQILPAVEFKQAFENRAGNSLGTPTDYLEKLRAALYTALAFAERHAPASAKGTFIPVSSPHDTLMAIAPVLGEATRDILIVDPYMSQVVLNDFALSVGEGVKLRLLSGNKKTNPDLEPALRAWRAQRTNRPIEIRLAKQNLLHDRLIIPDGIAWSLSQSFNMLAKRSPATLQPFETEIGRLKAAFYEHVWRDSAPL
jgi:hypothetical protein